jgi:D-alanine-D-alanine ligase
VFTYRLFGGKESSKMKIGIAYDLKHDFSIDGGRPDDWLEEYDSEDTIQAVQDAIEALGHEAVRLGGGRTFLERIGTTPVDLVFNLAEGSKGRNREAHIPALLEMLEIPYTHSDPLTLAVTLDKEMAKRIILSEGIPTPAFELIRSQMDAENIGLPLPLFVKPAHEGSSKGIRSHSRVNDKESLKHEVHRLLGDYGTPVLVETFLPGREFTVGILGNGLPYVLGIMEVAPSEGPVEDFIYSVSVKRECNQRVRYRYPPDLSPSLLRRIEEVALGSYTVLGCRDVARIDIRFGEDGIPYFLEANPLPGLAPGYSDLVILADFMGWSHRQLIEAILCHAFGRYGIDERAYSDISLVMRQPARRRPVAYPPG